MKKRVSVLLALVMLLQFVFSVPLSANNIVMIRPLVDTNTNSYKAEVVADNPTWFGRHKNTEKFNFNAYFLKGQGSSENVANGQALNRADTTDMIKSPSKVSSLDNDFGYTGYMELEGFKDDSGKLVFDSTTEATENTNVHEFAKDAAASVDMFPLAFPGSHSYGAKDVTALESDYAIEVATTLSSNLNTLLMTINGGRKFSSPKELVNKSIIMRPSEYGFTIVPKSASSSSNAGFVILYGEPNHVNGEFKRGVPSVDELIGKDSQQLVSGKITPAGLFEKVPIADESGNLLAYVFPIKSKTQNISYDLSWSDIELSGMSTFIWAMPKGYTKISDDFPLRFPADSNKNSEQKWIASDGDVPWVTIHYLSAYANSMYKQHNLSIGSADTAGETNMIMKIIIEVFQFLLNGLQTIFGLTDTYSLVFNRGARASSSYNYGAMSDAWWAVVLRYHLIFQALAWFIIICGLIKMLIELNLSTVNPGRRMFVYEMVSKFLLVGFLLVTIIPIIQFALTFNHSIVGIFASQVDPNSTNPPIAGGLAGLVVQFCYFGILMYMNFVYIMRSIIIGILTVTSPFFISSITFTQRRTLFESWFKELTANIFMQSVHAFSLAFLMNLVQTGGGLESLVVSYSIIPITELVRNLIFQGAGSATEQLGKNASQQYYNAGTATAKGVANAGAGAINKQLNKSAEGKGTTEGNLSGGMEGSGFGSGMGAGGGRSQTPEVSALSSRLQQMTSGASNAAKQVDGSNVSGGTRADASFGAAMAKGGSAVMSGLSGLGNLAGGMMDIGMAQISQDSRGFSDAGSKVASAITDSGRVGLAGGAGIGHVASGVSAAVSKPSNAPGAAVNSTTGDNAIVPKRVRTDPRTGQNVSEYSTSQMGAGMFFEGADGSFNRTIREGDIPEIANNDSDSMGAQAATYLSLQGKTDSGSGTMRAAIEENFASQGYSLSTVQGGVNVSMKKSDFSKVGMSRFSVSSNGENAFVTSSGASTPNARFGLNSTPIVDDAMKQTKEQSRAARMDNERNSN